MTQRFDPSKLIPEGYKAMYGLHLKVQSSGLGVDLLELVRLRVSQINGCAYCIAMHIPLGREHGLTEHQLNLTAAWKDAPVFSTRQRAALAWAEAVTVLANREVSDEVYEVARAEFDETELAQLTLAVCEINAWNRLSIASRLAPVLV